MRSSSPQDPQLLTRRTAVRCSRPKTRPLAAVPPVFLALAMVLSTGCAHKVPLGGIGVGRGQPIHEGQWELTTGLGTVPNVSGTAPELIAADGTVANPVLSGQDLWLRYPEIIDLGLTFSTGGRADIGWSLSRGLHGMVEVTRARHVSLSLSPALFWWKRVEPFASGHRGSTRNLNLTALLSYRNVFREGEEEERATALEAWLGAGVNRYRLELIASGDTVSHAASPASVVAGVSFMARRLRVVTEVGGAWIQQRGRPRQIAPAFRIYVSGVGASILRRRR